MGIRYFEIRSPRADFTGRIGPVAFADGVAHVQFDDERDADGQVLAEENGVSPGRAAVMFARRRTGYTVTELDDRRRPLQEDAETDDGLKRPSKGASAAAWRSYALAVGVDPELVGATDSRADLIALVEDHDTTKEVVL